MLIMGRDFCNQLSAPKKHHFERNISAFLSTLFAIDHRTCKTGLPVRSAVLKPRAGRLVVGWVTTSEYLLLIVFVFFVT
jgi:hypothetical protein